MIAHHDGFCFITIQMIRFMESFRAQLLWCLLKRKWTPRDKIEVKATPLTKSYLTQLLLPLRAGGMLTARFRGQIAREVDTDVEVLPGPLPLLEGGHHH